MKRFNMLFTAWCIIVVMIMTGLIVLGFAFKKNLKEYKLYEKRIVSATEEYIKDNDISVKKNEELKISINKLKKHKYLSKKDIIKSCSGGAIVKKTGVIPNIKCKYYKSIK